MSRLALIVCLAASAGIHLALAAQHGVSFHVAAALLALAAGTLAVGPGRGPAVAAGALLAGLLGAFLLAGEPLDGVSAVTKSVEAVGLVCAIRLSLAAPPRRPERVATLVVAGMIAVLAAAITPGDTHAHTPGTPTHGH